MCQISMQFTLQFLLCKGRKKDLNNVTRVSNSLIVKYLFHSLQCVVVISFMKLSETLKLCWNEANSQGPNVVTSTHTLGAVRFC